MEGKKEELNDALPCRLCQIPPQITNEASFECIRGMNGGVGIVVACCPFCSVSVAENTVMMSYSKTRSLAVKKWNMLMAPEVEA